MRGRLTSSGNSAFRAAAGALLLMAAASASLTAPAGAAGAAGAAALAAQPAGGAAGDNFAMRKAALMGAEQHARFDAEARAGLSAAELTLNAHVLALKGNDTAAAAIDGAADPFAEFKATRDSMRASPLFDLLGRAPKGGALHLHTGSMVDSRVVVDLFTSRPHAYVFRGEDDADTTYGTLMFFNESVGAQKAAEGWAEIAAERPADDPAAAQAYDDELYSLLTLPGYNGLTVDGVWQEMNKVFIRLVGLQYAPVWADYTRAVIDSFVADNVSYLEIRAYVSGSAALYELDGRVLEPAEALQILVDVAKEKQAQYGERFLGAKFVYTDVKSNSVEEVAGSLADGIAFQEQFPGWVKGYDLVGQEDPLLQLDAYADVLQARMGEIPYLFHAGETLRESNTNLFDALLLGTRRIGHGYQLRNHPELLDIVRRRGVAVEVCPISNQVLALTDDLRDHAGAQFAAEGVPFVVAPDDPGIYQVNGSTADFYLATISFGGMDLASVKQLAMNSFTYSLMDDAERASALEVWGRQWEEWVESEVSSLP